MTTSTSDRALLDLVSLVDAAEHTYVRVSLRAGGTGYIGRLISEVAYRKSVTAVLLAGNAAPVAATFRAYEEMAEEKRVENARRIDGRPHTPIPELPDALHILAEEDDGSDRVWRLRFEAVDGWSLLDFSIELPTGA